MNRIEVDVITNERRTVQLTPAEEADAQARVSAETAQRAVAAAARSDLDNVDKGLKALALCVAQVGGLTVPQIKAMFKQKWDSLP